MDADDLHDLIPAYALDALEPAEARLFEEHLAGCESCRSELAVLSESAAALAFAAGPAPPPPELRDRILAAVRAERPNVVPLRPRLSRPLAAVAAAAVAAAAGLAIWNVSLHGRLDRAQEALRGVPLNGASGSVVVSGDEAALVLTGVGRAPAGKTYEAWVIAGSRAERAGVFAGGEGTVVVRLTHAVPAGAVVAVTVERAGGVDAPTRKPFITSAPV
ncbi:MAG TPA: anti-sigma factor [Gaiellaceae bacterium]|nr:anti-sigma factor [Gaiellaceae bacterium]